MNLVINFELYNNIHSETKWIKKLVKYKTFKIGYVLYINQCVPFGYFQWICVKYLLSTGNLWICISL